VAKNILKFDKKVYWDRRRKGMHGQIHPPDSPEARYDARKAFSKIREDQFKQLEKGIPDERKNRKSSKKSLQS
jgi:hypothetical protein